MIAMGIDPGFASIGIAIVELTPETERVRSLDVFNTEKSDKKLDVRASADNFRRAREIARYLGHEFAKHGVGLVCAEAMSFARDASVANKMGLSWGVLAALCEARSIPLVQASPQAIKKALCARKDASKDDVQFALRVRYAEVPDMLAGMRKGDLEHAADALGAVVACMDSELVRLARRQ